MRSWQACTCLSEQHLEQNITRIILDFWLHIYYDHSVSPKLRHTSGIMASIYTYLGEQYLERI